jgi:hypothetical protein
LPITGRAFAPVADDVDEFHLYYKF